MATHAVSEPEVASVALLPPGPRLSMPVQTVLWEARFAQFNLWCWRRFGDYFTVHLPFSGQMVVVADPDAIRVLFADRGERTHAGEANAVLEPVLGANSVLLLDGPEHMRQRRLMHPPFHGERMNRYREIIAGITADEVSRWPVGKEFSLLPSTQSLTLRVILRAVFGLEEGEVLDSIRTKIKRVLDEGKSRFAMVPQFQRDVGPFKFWTAFVRKREALDRDLFAEMERRRAAGNLEEREDILSLLMLARDEDGRPMSDVELRDELMTLLLAGHETTASSLAWFFDLVLHNPGVLERLRGDALRGDTAYLDAAITESMRVRPVVPLIARRLLEPVELGGWQLPAGAIIAPNIFLIHRRPEIYPEPLRFRPDRFMDGRVDSFSWLPFGGGIRRCVGAAFATFEMQTVIPEVLRRVRLEPASPKPERSRRRAVTLIPACGTRLLVRERLAA